MIAEIDLMGAYSKEELQGMLRQQATQLNRQQQQCYDAVKKQALALGISVDKNMPDIKELYHLAKEFVPTAETKQAFVEKQTKLTVERAKRKDSVTLRNSRLGKSVTLMDLDKIADRCKQIEKENPVLFNLGILARKNPEYAELLNAEIQFRKRERKITERIEKIEEAAAQYFDQAAQAIRNVMMRIVEIESHCQDCRVALGLLDHPEAPRVYRLQDAPDVRSQSGLKVLILCIDANNSAAEKSASDKISCHDGNRQAGLFEVLQAARRKQFREYWIEACGKSNGATR